jgi:hypothetical protein
MDGTIEVDQNNSGGDFVCSNCGQRARRFKDAEVYWIRNSGNSNYYCPEHGSKQFETERDMLNYIKNQGVTDLNIYAHNAKIRLS